MNNSTTHVSCVMWLIKTKALLRYANPVQSNTQTISPLLLIFG